jgi:outer membrane murein-binding lipoprotein Lpp
MKKAAFILVLLSVLLASSGCQSWQKADQDARAVALVTSQRVLTIKKELEGKIAAERKYYKAQFDTIEKSNNRSDEIELERKNPVRRNKFELDQLLIVDLIMADLSGLELISAYSEARAGEKKR